VPRRRGYRPPVRLGRIEEVRPGAERVLIVCEGECTEPFYIDDLRRDLQLTSVEVRGRECGSDPRSVVDYALEQYAEDTALDRIFCLIDRDEHASFDEARQVAKQANRNGVPIQVIASFPSFEFWYLLHYTYTRAPIVREGNRSPGQNAERALKSQLADYTKSRRDLWTILRKKVPTAVANSKRATAEARADGEPNPSTEVHKLVAYLMRLARQ
jgi:hypothetical protein